MSKAVARLTKLTSSGSSGPPEKGPVIELEGAEPARVDEREGMVVSVPVIEGLP